MKKILSSAVLALLVCTASAASAAVTVTVEAAGVQNTTVALTTVGVETFDTAGYSSPLSTGLLGNTGLTGSYDSALTYAASQYGGAGGTGSYLAVQTTSTVTLSGDATYFGLWASALDGGNTVEFYKNGMQVGSVNLTSYALGSAYYGNPTAPFSGQDSSEKFAFFNFAVSGGYDQVKLVENGGGGFENDNNTFGTLAAVPEPATWAMMIGGLGLVGGAMRRRRTATAAVA